MQQELKNVPKDMLELGLAALAHANWHANFYSFENDKWSELSVLQAAHAAEILIKARIAEEHPLLIFDQIPRSTQVDGETLDFKALVQKAKTIQYSELPERLWATAGIKLPNLGLYKEFGMLRNSIQHFAIPQNSSCTSTDFIYGVIDPFINECWGLYAIDFHEDTEPYVNIVDTLLNNEIEFLVSPGCSSSYMGIEPSSFTNRSYAHRMNLRFEKAMVGEKDS
ncbi:hypothetical protein AB6E22_18980 [Vibrio cyclitrophicus]|uniref:hypothetical protein n=1 Tax=Vibrio TaxID=662 RepID=UPI0002F4128F|nr:MULTISPECIES: hypothetical protein [Vibrio]NOI89580.1 hypothetical protein [Vibrio splendidus]OEF20694.1 hypothetical protein A145_03040 [Vibrio splendidus 5S-101]PMK22956.1 hypothetical protein BCU04_15680 [Vibrio cyclitrophicus]